MKKITLREATTEQITDAIRRDPERWVELEDGYDIEDVEIEVYKAKDYLHIKCMADYHKVGESWFTSYNIMDKPVEVED